MTCSPASRFVCALGTADVTAPSGPTLFRSYAVAKNEEYNCTIWEAARATSAAPTFFERINIGPPGCATDYVDAGLGCNNPVKYVVEEAERIFEGEEYVACLLSIGTGLAQAVKLARPKSLQNVLGMPTHLVEPLKAIATDSGKTAEEIGKRYRKTPGIYYRLDVDRGMESVSLDEWDRLGDVRSLTKNYLKTHAIDTQVDALVESLSGSSTRHSEMLLNLSI